MKLGIQPTGWTNDDFTEVGDNTPFQTILQETAEVGFCGGSTGHNYPKHLPSLLCALREQGLQICGTWASTSFTTLPFEEAMSAIQKEIAFLKEVGASDLVVAELGGAVNQVRTASVLSDRPTLSEPLWYLLTRGLQQAGKLARDNGMRLCYHPHVGTVIQTAEETERLMEQTEPELVALCLDTAHLKFGGADPFEITKKFIGRIGHVHLKNTRRAVREAAEAQGFSFYQAVMEGVFAVPGDSEGEIDLDPIVEALRAAAYEGWMVVEAEQDPAKAPPLEQARTAREYLREQLGL